MTTDHSNTNDDTDDVTGTYYDGDSAEFLSVIHSDDHIELYYADQSPNNTAPIVAYTSTTEFHDEEQNLIRIPDRVVENPVPVAEQVYENGFNNAVDWGDFESVLWATEHTEIVSTDTERDNSSTTSQNGD